MWPPLISGELRFYRITRAIPASIKAAAFGISGVSSFPEHRREALLTGRLEEPLPSPSKYLERLGRDSPYSSSGMALLIVARFRDILESSQRAIHFIQTSKDTVKQKKIKKTSRVL